MNILTLLRELHSQPKSDTFVIIERVFTKIVKKKSGTKMLMFAGELIVNKFVNECFEWFTKNYLFTTKSQQTTHLTGVLRYVNYAYHNVLRRREYSIICDELACYWRKKCLFDQRKIRVAPVKPHYYVECDLREEFIGEQRVIEFDD